MNKQSSDHVAKFEEAFKRFLELFMTRRDIESLTEMLGETHCGFGTGFDEVAYSKNKGIELFQRDITSVPSPLHYTLHHYEIKLLDQYNAIVMAHLDIEMKVMDQEMKMNNLRKMMIFRDEDNIIKIVGLHFSFPTDVHAEGESYPLKELEERTKVLTRMVEEKTKDLQKAITELKQSEEVLKESEERNRAILSALPDLFFISSRDGHYLDYHASNPELLAKDPRHFLGKSPLEVLPEELAQAFLHSFQQVYKTGQLQIIQYPLEVHGCLRYFEARTTSIDEHRLITIIRDMTDYREKEDEIIKQKERLANIIEGTNVGTWEWNVQTGETIFNERWAEIIGYTLEELLPVSIDKWMEYLHPEDLETRYSILEKHFKGEIDYYDVEGRMKHKEGHWVWVQERGKVVSWTDDEKPLWMFGTHQDITEHKWMEERLRENEERYRTIYNFSPVGIMIENDKGTILEVNQSMCEISDYREEELKGKSIFETLAKGEYKEAAKRNIARILAGEDLKFDIESRTKRGEIQYKQIIETRITLPDGNIGILSIHVDITDRKKMEDALITSEKRINTMLNNTPDMVVRFNTDLQHIYCNKAVERELGIPADFFIGRSFLDLDIPDQEAETAKSIHQYLVKCLETGEKQYCNTKVLTPSGLKHYSTIIIPERHNESIESLLAVTRDITDMRMAEERLRLQSLVLNQIQDRVTVTDLNGVITYVNDAEAQALGYSRQELIDTTIEKFGEDPEEGSTQREILEETLRYGTWRGEVVNQTVDGQKLYMDCRTQVVLDDEGNSIALAGISTDITERKKMEETIQYQHDFQKIVAHISYGFINNPGSTIDEAINDILYQIGTFFHVDGAYFFQSSSNDMFFSNTHKWNREGVESVDIIQNLSVEKIPWFIHEIRSKEYVFIPDTNAIGYEVERKEFQRKERQSLIIIPIKIKENVVGFIGMDAVTDKKSWTDEEITQLKVIGEIISSALSKQQIEDELIQRNQEVEQLNQHLNQEMEKVHQIHSNILPEHLPSVQGINFAAFYQPAETLGGDFYEVIQVDNKLVIYLSDISGHGLDGGMINIFVKETIDSYITLKPDTITPGSILRHLDLQYRKRSYPDDMFICIFLAVLDLETMELKYIGAGFQNEILLWQGNGEERRLITKGLFINSIFPVDKNSFQEKVITLTPGSVIFFNTDGLTEQGEPGAFYRERLPQVFYENAVLPPDGISQVILEDFRQFNNGSLQGDDDITFLILQVAPENTRHELELTTGFDKLVDVKEKIVAILPNIEEVDVIIGCLYELISNAMEHGNQMDPKKRIFLEILVSTEYIQVSIEDEGEGFNWRDRVDEPLELGGYAERGRGIAMTKRLCHSLYYNEQGNKAICLVLLGQRGGVCK